MDDKPKPLAPSLQGQLIRALAWAIVLVALVSAAFSLLSAYHEAGELQDELLHQTALALARNAAPALQTDAPMAAPPLQPQNPHHDDEHDDDPEEAEEAALIVQTLGSNTPLALPAGLADGLHDVQVRGHAYRVLLHHTRAGTGFAIAQRADFRQELALASAARSTLPLLFLLPVLVLLVSLRVRQTLSPVAALAQELQERSAQQLQALKPQDVPSELRPFVLATNALLQRVAGAMHNQQRFVADAAHELRTPLAALGLQAEALAQCDLPAPAQTRLAALQTGLARQGVLVAQLLDLARVQAATSSSTNSSVNQPVAVLDVIRQVVQDCLPLAQAKHIDLGLDGDAAQVQNQQLALPEHELYILLKNLVDNALRYSPAGGRVDIRLQPRAGRLCLAVADRGPGIAPAERQRVLQPFYRGAAQTEAATAAERSLGSGLGLAIVDGIAQRWGILLRLDWNDATQQSGLLAELLFPAQKS
jgi:two-component system OmpR family sensor kinase